MKKSQAIDIQKQYKTAIQIMKVAEHNLRTGKTPDNVDASKSHLNKLYYGSYDMDVNKEIDSKLEGVKYRKDAVKTAHMTFSVSPEWFDMASQEQIALWEQNTLNYVKEMFGEQNIVYAVVHYDEETPHMHVCAVPLVDNKLNFKKLFNGKKGIADNFHTKYNTFVKDLGIERGERYSKAKRVDIKEFTARMKKSQNELTARIDKFDSYIQTVSNEPVKLNRLFQFVKLKIMPTVQAMKDKLIAKDKEIVKNNKKLAKIADSLEPLREILDFDETPSKMQLNDIVENFKTYQLIYNSVKSKSNISNVIQNYRTPEPTQKDCDSNKAANSSTSIPAPPIKPKK